MLAQDLCASSQQKAGTCSELPVAEKVQDSPVQVRCDSAQKPQLKSQITSLEAKASLDFLLVVRQGAPQLPAGPPGPLCDASGAVPCEFI